MAYGLSFVHFRDGGMQLAKLPLLLLHKSGDGFGGEKRF
jgi:hypothetical protein